MNKIGEILRLEERSLGVPGKPCDETTYRQSTIFSQSPRIVPVKGRSTQTGKTEFDSVLPACTQPADYAALGLISIVFAFAVFGMVNCNTPFFNVAVVFSASTLAGRSTIRRIWFEQDSE